MDVLDCKLRYSVLKSAIDDCNNKDKIIQGIDYYFSIHKNGKNNQNFFTLKESKDFLFSVAREIINRDYSQYIKTGNWGSSSSDLLKILTLNN